MSQSINKNFTTWSLLGFAFPSIIMMVFMSLYTIVDGMFVSRLVGSDALSSVNIVYPVLSVVIAVGVMLATGGSAVVSKLLGEGKKEEAYRSFTMITVVGVVVSLILLAVTLVAAEPISYLLGADETLIYHCKLYLIVMMLFAPACVLQSLYQCFFVTAGRPQLGLWLIVIGGVANIVFDYLFMAVFHMGVAGAALATGIGQSIPAIFGTVFFFVVRKELYFTRFKMQWKMLLQTCANGSSEMVTQLSNAVITALFNLILMRMAGSDGVAAITIILYGQFLFSSLYLGFTIGVGPIFGFSFGAKNFVRLKKLHGICGRLVAVSGIGIALLSWLGAPYIVGAFVGADTGAYALAVKGFALFSLSYLFCGVNIYFSGIFTAVSDGKNSAIISFMRTFVFIVAALLILPAVIGINGVWLAVPAAEFVTVFLALRLGKRKLPM